VSSTLTRIKNVKNKEQSSNGSGGGWFKSLDRLTKRGKGKAKVSATDKCLQLRGNGFTQQ
jgi:hypothetical protein